MKVRWSIVVEGADVTEMMEKATQAWKEFMGDARIKGSAIPEPIFLDIEPVDDEIKDGKITLYKAWARRDVEIAE